MSAYPPRQNGGAPALSPAASRECGSCTLCCKVYEVPVLKKPEGQWCGHCSPGKGCGVWDSRPDFCRDFHCLWIDDLSFGPEWKPEIAKFVMNIEEGGDQLVVMVDPGQRAAWKREPYHSSFRTMAAELWAERRMTIVVLDGVTKILVLPDEDKVIGGAREDVSYAVATRDVAGRPLFTVTIGRANENGGPKPAAGLA
jgi:hypothetical protein